MTLWSAVTAAALALVRSSWLQASAIGHRRNARMRRASSLPRPSWPSPPRRPRWSIQVGPPGSVPGNSFVRLRGLPASVSLTEGYAIAPGSWAVPLFGLPTLKAIVPAGVSGRSEITIHLVGVDGTTLAETRTALVVGPAAMIAPAEQTHPTVRRRARACRLATAACTAPAPERSAQPPPSLSARGQGARRAPGRQRRPAPRAGQHRRRARCSFSAPRKPAWRTAPSRWPRPTIRPSSTRLQVKVQGAIPDRAEARKWYERARELGAPEAEERLARIGGS